MFHARLAVSAALRAGLCLIEMFGVLALHDLIKLGRHELADLVTGVFDLGPRGLKRRPLAILLGTDQAGQFLHLGDYYG
jgi:hypothetical protein